MSKEDVEKLLLAGGADKDLRYRYNQVESKEKFVVEAKTDGYEFTVEELDEVLVCQSKTAESYHRENCSALKQCSHEVAVIKIDEAKTAGRKPCGRCY